MKKAISVLLALGTVFTHTPMALCAGAAEINFDVEHTAEYAGGARSAVPSASSVSVDVTGKDGDTADIDPRFPGLYVLLPKRLDEETVDIENIGCDAVKYIDYLPEEDTLILYVGADMTGACRTLSLDAWDSGIKTVDGETLSFGAVTLSFAEYAKQDAGNMIPYGENDSSYPGAYADAVYTLSKSDGIIYAGTETKTAYKAPFIFPAPFEEYASYRFHAEIMPTSVVCASTATPKTSFKINPSVLFNDSERKNSDLACNADKKNHIAPGVTLTVGEWTDVSFDFDIYALEDRSRDMGIRLYLNPTAGSAGSANVSARNVSLYKRLDIRYESGELCRLKDGAAAPEATAGVFLDGKSGNTCVAIPDFEMPYEVCDPRFRIDEAKPWKDKAGHEYALGDEIDFTVIGTDIVLQPNVKTDAETAVITFDGTHLISSPKPLTAFVDDTLDLSDFSDVQTDTPGLHFFGWSTENGNENAVTDVLTVSESVTLYPVVSYDYDFNYSGCYAEVTTEAGQITKYCHGNGIRLDNVPSYAKSRLRFEGTVIPTAVYSKVSLLFDADEVSPETFAPVLYFCREGETLSKERTLNASDITEVTIGGRTYCKVTYDAYTHALWDGKITSLTVQPFEDNTPFTLYRLSFEKGETAACTEIHIGGFEYPAVGGSVQSADSLTVSDADAAIRSLSYSPMPVNGGRTFDSDTVYTVTMELTPKQGSGVCFPEDMTATLNGGQTDVKLLDDGTLLLTAECEKTAHAEKCTVTFDGTGLIRDSFTAKMTAFKGIPMTFDGFMRGTPGTAGCVFNGWSYEKNRKTFADVIDTICTEEDITVYPVINYDLNFSVPANNTWYSSGYPVTAFFLKKYLRLEAVGGDHSIRFHSNAPLDIMKGITLYYDAACRPSSSDLIYFCRAEDGSDYYTADRRMVFASSCVDEETGYYAISYIPAEKSLWTGTMNTIRVDAFGDEVTSGFANLKAVCYDTKDVITDAIVFENITVPSAGTADTTTEACTEKNGLASLKSVSWSPALFHGHFEENTVYTATLTLIPREDYRFSDETPNDVSFDSYIGTDVAVRTNGTMNVSFTFPETGAYETFDIHIVGDTEIYHDNCGYAYTAAFSETVADDAVVWSSSDTSVAEIDEITGILTTKASGRTVLTATSLYNRKVTDSMTVTVSCHPMTMEITGPKSIAKANRATVYGVRITSDNTIFDRSASYFVDDPTVAAVDEKSGKLVPFKNGRVTLTAVSNYDKNVSDTLEITITNQSAHGYVRYHACTSDTVDNMPEDQIGDTETLLSLVSPTRKGYAFIGWSLSEDSVETVSTVSVSENDVDVYAVWAKGVSYTFGNGGNAGAPSSVKQDGYAEAVTTGYDYRIALPSVDLDPDTYKTVLVGMACEKQNVPMQLFYKASYLDEGTPVMIGYDTDAFKYAESMSMSGTYTGTSLNDFRAVAFPMYDTSDYGGSSTPGAWKNGIADRIVGLYVDPCKNPNTKLRIAYIAVIEPECTITFDMNCDDAVTDIPETQTAEWGKKYTVSGRPSRKGYDFIGYAADADVYSYVGDTFAVKDDMTLYAVWSRLDDDGKTLSLGTPDENCGALLVGAADSIGEKVVLSASSDAGEVHLTAQVNQKGYAWFDLSDASVYDVCLTMPRDFAVDSFTWTDVKTAKNTAEIVEVEKKDKNRPVDFTAHDVAPSGDSYQTTVAEEETDVLDGSFFSFEDEDELKLFGTKTQTKNLKLRDGSLVIDTQGYKSSTLTGPSVTSAVLGKNIAETPYMVIRAKKVGREHSLMRVYFREKNGDFTEQKTVSRYLSGEYENLVFDLSALPMANGTLEQFKIAFAYTETGEVLIDSVAFTAMADDIPSDGAEEPFPIVRMNVPAFTDVHDDDWFCHDVTLSFHRGLIDGMSDEIFAPYGNMTIAEAIAAADKMYRVYHRMDELEIASEGVWYDVYVNDAVHNGIIHDGEYTDFDADATRREAAMILYHALPSDYYTTINMFEDIVDLSNDDKAYGIVLRLYQSGILTGVGETYAFMPDAPVKRCEMAAILARMAVKDNRIRVITAAEEAKYTTHYSASDLVSLLSFAGCGDTALTDDLLWSRSVITDPNVGMTRILGGKDGSEIEQIRIGFVFGGDVANPINGGCRIYYTTPFGGWAEERSVAPTWDGKRDENGVALFVFDTSEIAAFQTTISEIRFDPFNACASFAVQYIDIKHKHE